MAHRIFLGLRAWVEYIIRERGVNGTGLGGTPSAWSNPSECGWIAIDLLKEGTTQEKIRRAPRLALRYRLRKRDEEIVGFRLWGVGSVPVISIDEMGGNFENSHQAHARDLHFIRRCALQLPDSASHSRFATNSPLFEFCLRISFFRYCRRADIFVMRFANCTHEEPV